MHTTCAHLHTMMTHAYDSHHVCVTRNPRRYEGLPLLPHCLSSTTVFSIFAFLPSFLPLPLQPLSIGRMSVSILTGNTNQVSRPNTIPYDRGESIFVSVRSYCCTRSLNAFFSARDGITDVEHRFFRRVHFAGKLNWQENETFEIVVTETHCSLDVTSSFFFPSDRSLRTTCNESKWRGGS